MTAEAYGAPDAEALAGRFAQLFGALAGNIERVIRGKRENTELAMRCLRSEGHLLLEDVPGTGKTTLARAIAASVDAEWTRIQFTPNQLPSNVTGVSIFNQATNSFEFHTKPNNTNNNDTNKNNQRTPKTQSALLE